MSKDDTPRCELKDIYPSDSVRLAVFKGTAQRKHLSTVTLRKAEGVSWTLEATGPAADEVLPALERFTEARRALAAADAAPPETSPADALTAMLTTDNFIVERLPAGDHQLNFQIDLQTGKVVGTHEAMHPLANAEDGVGRKVFEAIAGGLSKFGDELADEIEKRLAENDVNGAATAIKHGLDNGLFGLKLSKRLLEALLKIDVTGLAAPERRHVRDSRLITAQQLGRFDVAGLEADNILADDEETFDPGQIATLKMAAALGSLARGNRETALTTLRNLLKEPSDLDAEGRGWVQCNISTILPNDDPEARRAAQESSDAFLQAGNKVEAGKSLMRVANILMRTDPAEAVKKLDEMMTFLDREGLNDRRIRGAAHHARANRLAKLNKHADAFRDATEAVELMRGLMGAEGEFISSLHLASIEAGLVGKPDKASKFAAEATKLTEELKIPHFLLAERVTTLLKAFDPKVAQDLLRDAEAAKNLEIIAAVRVLQATLDTSLTALQRLALLEETYRQVREAHGPRPLLHSIMHGVARQLAAMNELPRAVEWYRKKLADDPLDMQAGGELLNCLWEMKEWGKAAVFVRTQLELVGEKPGMLFAYGKSLFESGDMSKAVTALTKSLKLAGGDVNLRKHATELREKALEAGGTVLPPVPERLVNDPVTREEFERALDDFARFIKARKRMEFWAKLDDEERKWVSRPERLAQNLLHTFLDARFRENVEVFDELAAGAGRIDLYVKLSGSLSIIVELKMCGSPGYSAPYAASGEEQIMHYMDNKDSHLGYLVVFDGRTTTFGQALLSHPVGQNTVIEKFVDVRHQVTRR
jgi:tetratricopeptide (TPR) repeat protein